MLGVKEFIAEFKEPFDADVKAVSKAKKILRDRGEKISPDVLKEEAELILEEWDNKRLRGIRVQQDICQKEILNNKDAILGVYQPSESVENFDFSICKLQNRKTYLEKCLVSKKYGLIGYADKIDIQRSTINITDNKVIDKIYYTGSFKTNTGFLIQATQMLAPLQHLEDCNYNEMVLQLSLYMYLAWENNKNLKIGKLFIRHIQMNDKDKITADVLIEVPYMKSEVIKMLKYKKLNDE